MKVIHSRSNVKIRYLTLSCLFGGQALEEFIDIDKQKKCIRWKGMNKIIGIATTSTSGYINHPKLPWFPGNNHEVLKSGIISLNTMDIYNGERLKVGEKLTLVPPTSRHSFKVAKEYDIVQVHEYDSDKFACALRQQ